MGKIVRINPGSGFNSPQYGLSSRPKSPVQENFPANMQNNLPRYLDLPWFGLTSWQKAQRLDSFVKRIPEGGGT